MYENNDMSPREHMYVKRHEKKMSTIRGNKDMRRFGQK